MSELELFLITYNRKDKLTRTLEQLLGENSPLKNYPITILDNASTDGTGELLARYAQKFPSIRYIRHPKNIGGNGNIARAFEMARAEYVWVLCDDDVYDFAAWGEFLDALKKKPAAVVVADYASPRRGPAALFKQLSFVPAGVYRTDLLTADTLINMYFNISNMFPQLAVAAAVFNSGGPVLFLSKPLVTMQLSPGNDSYVRGSAESAHPLMAQMFWQLGYLRSLPMIKDKRTRVACAFLAGVEEECFYNFCGRFMAQGAGPFYTYSAALRILPGRAWYAFALCAWPAWICSFYADEKGYNCRLFGRIKFRLCKRNR